MTKQDEQVERHMKSVMYLVMMETIHDVNNAIRVHFGEKADPPLNELSKEVLVGKLNGIKKVIENPGITPEMMHKEWMDSHIKDGWVYGEVKDFEKKTHPCLIPYEELPENQRLKDRIFVALVNSMKYKGE